MLNNWLTPLSGEHTSSYFTSVYHDKDDFPNLEGGKIVLFSKESAFSNLVRQKMDSLHNHFKTSIIDIGVLNSTNNSSIYQAITELHDGFIVPVLLGIDQASFVEFCKALTLEHKLDIAAHVSNTAIGSTDSYAIENIGYQRHLIPKHLFDDILESNNPGMSLGMLRTNSKILEPILPRSQLSTLRPGSRSKI